MYQGKMKEFIMGAYMVYGILYILYMNQFFMTSDKIRILYSWTKKQKTLKYMLEWKLLLPLPRYKKKTGASVTCKWSNRNLWFFYISFS